MLLLLAVQAAAMVAPKPLRLLTFDLDDTLFPCGQVVQRANSALGIALSENGGDQAADIQGTIRQVRKQHAASGGDPVTYTELRYRAIAEILGNPRRNIVEKCFETWLDERQAAANELLFEGVVDAVSSVRRDFPECIIGAVTNARGDPRGMPRLASLFDFCVSGEDESVWPNRKPSPLIYEHALRVASTAESMGFDGMGTGADSFGVGLLRDAWVHVGDCLLNDVEASKRAGAQTVWFDGEAGELNSFSTASPEEEARRIEARAKALAAGYVDERIESIAALPHALEKLLLR